MPPCRLRQPGPPARVRDRAPVIHDERFASVVDPDAPLLVMYDQATFSEGPVWWAAHDTLVWSDIEGRRVLGLRPDGAVDVVCDATAFINGNAVDPDGRLLHCEHGRRGVSRQAERGEPIMLVTHYGERRLNSPNDLVVAPDGAIWFTDPTFGIRNPRQGCPATPELEHRSVYRYEPATDKLTRMADLAQPNGLAFAPDGRTLYVSDSSRDADGDGHEIVAFSVAADGGLTGRRTFRVIEPGVPDGIDVDARGWVWTSSGSGVQVFDADGTPLGEIPTPHPCSNLAFGGADGRRLFVTGGSTLWAMDLRR